MQYLYNFMNTQLFLQPRSTHKCITVTLQSRLCWGYSLPSLSSSWVSFHCQHLFPPFSPSTPQSPQWSPAGGGWVSRGGPGPGPQSQRPPRWRPHWAPRAPTWPEWTAAHTGNTSMGNTQLRNAFWIQILCVSVFVNAHSVHNACQNLTGLYHGLKDWLNNKHVVLCNNIFSQVSWTNTHNIAGERSDHAAYPPPHWGQAKTKVPVNQTWNTHHGVKAVLVWSVSNLPAIYSIYP